LRTFVQRWNTATRKMVLTGVLPPDSLESRFVEFLASDASVIVFTETTSNLHHPDFFPGIDKIIAPVENDILQLKALQPILLLSFGGMVISKKIKAFLRNYRPDAHFHIDEKKAYDTYFCLTHHFKTSPNRFFERVIPELNPVKSPYRERWLGVQQKRRKAHEAYIGSIPFSDLKVYDYLFNAIPDGQQLQSANSATIRYTQLFDLNKTLSVFCNRGTSGIDGSTSTAIGASLAVTQPTTFITGDLSFFYDSNALWNAYIRPDFRIILINNGGGGIFRIIAPNKDTPDFDTYFETTHNLTAEQRCTMHGFSYRQAHDAASLEKALSDFYTESDRPALLEIFTPRTLNDTVLRKYFEFLNND
ncbi:MAG: 2-succinyl-5-enolpyruvyl-6-hydroxy-3-cyclohexene-1-carboxylate synthase, partial [Sinomicrobium sp.]|nr:2-succinyl-5-enolpyruvyl-6-hydroxy-3-cyclohexene-1-carboxylate synthase [Sinomicrobium sp.]